MSKRTWRIFWLTFTNDALDMQTQTEIIDDLEHSLTNNERELCEGILTKDFFLYLIIIIFYYYFPYKR